MKIVDPKGVWYKNNGQYRMVDPESHTTFEPGELTKATATAWLKNQPVMTACADPLADSEPQVKLTSAPAPVKK